MAIQGQLGGNQALDNADHAKQALARSDLGQALFHISSSLAVEPTNKEWRGILDQVLVKAPDPMVFVRTDEKKADFITDATRAYVHAFKKEYEPAFVILASVVGRRFDAPFLAWAAEWAAQPEAIAAISDEALEQRILPPIVGALGHCPAPCPADDPRRGNCDAAVSLLGALYNRFAKKPLLLLGLSVALRRVGRFDEAIQFAGYAWETAKDWRSCVGLAAAFRDAKKYQEATQWFRHALVVDPNELAALLDIGDTWLQAERWDDAIAAYEELLSKRPGDAWAEASIPYARFRKTNDASHRDALFALADKKNRRAHELLLEIFGDEPYFTWLPAPGDSTYHAARNIMMQMEAKPPPPTGAGVTINLKYMEAPSALEAFKLFTRKKGWRNVGIGVKLEGVQSPDPRQPRKPVDFTLWAYSDKVPRPNAQPADPRATAAIADIARLPYCLPMWAPRAKALAEQMGEAWQNQLLCVMVNPPDHPDGIDPFAWMQRVQVATALVLGHMPNGRRALESLAFGPVDWTVDAGIIALGWMTRSGVYPRAEIEALFGELEKSIPQQGFTCFEYPLVNVWTNLGGHDEATKTRLANWKKRCESQKIEFAEEKHGGLTLEQYAELSALRDKVVGAHAGQLGGYGAITSAVGAIAGGGSFPELQALCQRFGIPAPMSAAAARVPAWDHRINTDQKLQKVFFELKQRFELKQQGIDPNSHEGRVAQQIRSGNFDVESAKQNQIAAAQAIEKGEGGDPDPVVFPGQKVAKLSDYVGMLKAMQGGDMMGALKKYGLDMGSYSGVATAWGTKLASDPVLNAKFGKMMTG